MRASRPESPSSSYSGLNLVIYVGLQLLWSTIRLLVEVRLCQESLIFSLAQSINGACKSAEQA
jgi:hypothetical protein